MCAIYKVRGVDKLEGVRILSARQTSSRVEIGTPPRSYAPEMRRALNLRCHRAAYQGCSRHLRALVGSLE